ncbi:MAG: cobalamin-dependent protein [Erythrobacter sp.]
MSAPGNSSGPGGVSGKSRSGMLEAGTAALRKVIANPLMRRKADPPRASAYFNNVAASDPVNAVLEGDIIPRLLMAHASGLPDGAREVGSRPGLEIDPEDMQRFADLPLKLEAPSLLEEVDRFLDQGVSVEAIYLDMLAPAARRLGEMWTNDECDFVDVTMGLWRLQEVMREVSMRSPVPIMGSEAPRSALFCPIPGDVHSFGAQMIEEVFARAGWQSEVMLQPERRELLDLLARKPVDVLGLTVSRSCPGSALASLIKAARSVAVNPHLSIIVGGHMINQKPGIVAEIGADGTGDDARAALETAERLVAGAPVRAHSIT